MEKIIRNLIICFISFSIHLFVLKTSYAQKNPLDKRISVSTTNKSIENTLNYISANNGVVFSYNSDIIPLNSTVSINLRNKTISKILFSILGNKYYFKTLGNHIIILKQSDIRNKITCTITGQITNSITGEKLSNASIYDLSKNFSTLSDSNGFYKLIFTPESESINLGFSKNNYTDTLIFIKSAITLNINIKLKPNFTEIEKIKTKQLSSITEFNINEYNLVKRFVKTDMLSHAKNLNIFEKRIGQFSILPYIGTNRRISGAIVNHISFNAIAGYSNGVNGVELGTLLNISKNEVKGFQFAGVGNITGGNTNGFQAASVFNRNVGNVSGLQLSGFSNIVLDSLKGVQIGFVNFVKINKGFQFGIINMADSSSGVSIGFITVVKKGYYNLSVFTDEMLIPNISFKMGTHKFYNIWGLSANKEMWGLTYGFGIHPKPENKTSLNYDLSFTQMSYKKTFEIQFCIKTKLQADLNIRLNKKLDIFTGISYNIFASDKIIDTELQNHITNITNSYIFTTTFKSARMQHWPGVSLGLKYGI